MGIKDRLAWLVGKSALLAMKLRKGGSSLPGYLAHKIEPNFLSHVTYPKLTIAVTGTNGKTSTANLLAHIFKCAGMSVAHNSKGANMMSGLATAIISATDFSLRVKADVAVLEIDEGSVPLAFGQLRPDYLVVTNFFRDQLERYGELETVIAKVADAITDEQVLVLNGNDPLTRKIASDHPRNRSVFFGVERTNQSITSEQEARESKRCPNCSHHLHYDFFHYSQIGQFDCSECGYRTPELDYCATKVNLAERKFEVAGESFESAYDNLYFLFNMIAAISVAMEAGICADAIGKALATFEIGDGRMEKVRLGEHDTFLNLVKNPAGLNQTISHILAQPHEQFSMFMALNNAHADSIDTSWIWDAALEKLDTPRLQTFICSGHRAYDLAVRLENAGVETNKIKVLPDVNEAIAYLRNVATGWPYVLTNYTPLQPVRRALKAYPENQ